MIKKICVATTLALLAVGCDSAQDKCYQIVVTPEREYYTTFYLVDLDSSCIQFTAYDGNDSSYVKVCEPWDVEPNPDYKP